MKKQMFGLPLRVCRKLRFYAGFVRSALMGWIMRKHFGGIETFCLFIGYPRSGHSLVAALLDAHPEVVMGMEWGVLYHLKMGYRKRQICYSLVKNAALFTKKKHNIWTGYSYRVNNSWQGRYSRLRVIGDKMGGRNSLLLEEDPGLIELLDRVTGLPLKWIHVIRNPFDTITTMTRRMLEKRNAWKENADPAELVPFIDLYFQRAATVSTFMRSGKMDMIHVYHEDLIARPEKELTRILDFLSLTPEKAYLDACREVVYEKPHKSRNLIPWTPELISKAGKEMARYGFLSRYSYTS